MTDPTPMPPRRLDAREMDKLARDAREILGKAANLSEVRIDPQEHVSDTNTRDMPRELNDLGRMSAEAVSAQYDAAAKAFEEMGPEVKERIAKIAGSLLELDRDLKEIAEMAAAIREKGKHVEAQIAEASALSVDIRSSAAEVRKKLGGL